MEKFIAFCKSYLTEILFAFAAACIFAAGVWTSNVTLALLCIFLLISVWNLFFHNSRSQGQFLKPQGPFLKPLDADNEADPVPEPAEKLPYVYYDSPREQVKHTICFYSPYLGKERAIPFRPRKARGKPFDNVRGIVVADNIVLLRGILFSSHFPDDIRAMAEQYEGRFPTEDELTQKSKMF